MSSQLSKQDLEKVSSLINPIHYAMMTTRGGNDLHSRPMAAQKIDLENKNLWFFTNQCSQKCQELESDNSANVSFMDPGRNTFVSFVGQSEICKDKRKMEELWDTNLKQWFPKELDDPNLCLLKFNIQGLEFWDNEKDVHKAFEL